MLPLLKHTLDHWPISNSFNRSVVLNDYTIVLTFLLASRCGDSHWKSTIVDAVQNLLGRSASGNSFVRYLEMCARQRKREISSRLASNDHVFVFDEDSPITPRDSAVYGEYLRSEAQTLIMLDESDLDGALELTSKFKTSCIARGSFSLMERYELRRYHLLEGKIMRWKGDFQTSVTILESLMQEASLGGLNFSVQEQLIASTCEQGDLLSAEKTARIAIASYGELLKAGLERDHHREYRSLQICLAEVLMCQIIADKISGKTTEVGDRRAVELRRLYDDLHRPEAATHTWATKFDTLRVYIGRALLAQMTDSLTQDLWTDVWKWAKECEKKVTAFVPAIVGYCDCQVQKKLGRDLEHEKLLKKAEDTWSRHVQKREYWWLGLGTFLVDWLVMVQPDSHLAESMRGKI